MIVYVVTFSDGRRMTFEAANREQARNTAYRIERSAAIASIDVAHLVAPDWHA